VHAGVHSVDRPINTENSSPTNQGRPHTGPLMLIVSNPICRPSTTHGVEPVNAPRGKEYPGAQLAGVQSFETDALELVRPGPYRTQRTVTTPSYVGLE